MTFQSLMKSVAGTAAMAISVAACSTTSGGGMTSFMPSGDMLKSSATVAFTATAVSECLNPRLTNKVSQVAGPFSGMVSQGAQMWAGNKYEMCKIRGNDPQVMFTSALLSKYALVEVASALADLETAAGAKDQKILQIAERVKVTPAMSLDAGSNYEELNAATDELNLLLSSSTEHPPEVIETAELARTRINAASEYVGQSIGGMIYLVTELGSMSPTNQLNFTAQVATLAGTESLEAENLMTTVKGSTIGTANSMMKLMQTSNDISALLRTDEYEIDPEKIKGQEAVTHEQLTAVLEGKQTTDLI